jgi:SanA protein
MRKNSRNGTRHNRWIRRSLLMAVILGLLMVVFILVIDWLVAAQGAEKVLSIEQLSDQARYDCVIVPGALVHADGTPSAMLQDRLDMAIHIIKSGITDRVLVSGDHGRPDYNEVGVMRQYLLNAGIPAEQIFMDHAGFDTYDTVYRAQSIFGVKRALITTQDFHLLRALYIGRQLGLDLYGIDCGYLNFAEDYKYRLREYPARVKAFLDCEILKSSPTYNGQVIPISGDGRLTLN